MASHIEMLRVAKDPAAVRSLATRLLATPNHVWTEWEVDFLENMTHFDGPDLISIRQREVLFELRDDAEYLTHYRGLRIATLISNCVLARFDLDEADAEFVLSLKGNPSIQRRKLGRLLRCCRMLGEIEPHM